MFRRFGKLPVPFDSNVSPITSFKKEWKYHLLINQTRFYCSRFAWFYRWFNLNFCCLHLLEHSGVHWLEALLLSTPQTDKQHETWTTPLLIHSLCYSYVLLCIYSENFVSCMAYFELWLSINFLLDETDVYRWDWNYRKNCSVSQHLLQFLSNKIAKKNQEDPGESLVDVNRKLITDDPENNIRNWFSDL